MNPDESSIPSSAGLQGNRRPEDDVCGGVCCLSIKVDPGRSHDTCRMMDEVGQYLAQVIELIVVEAHESNYRPWSSLRVKIVSTLESHATRGL